MLSARTSAEDSPLCSSSRFVTLSRHKVKLLAPQGLCPPACHLLPAALLCPQGHSSWYGTDCSITRRGLASAEDRAAGLASSAWDARSLLAGNASHGAREEQQSALQRIHCSPGLFHFQAEPEFCFGAGQSQGQTRAWVC